MDSESGGKSQYFSISTILNKRLYQFVCTLSRQQGFRDRRDLHVVETGRRLCLSSDGSTAISSEERERRHLSHSSSGVLLAKADVVSDFVAYNVHAAGSSNYAPRSVSAGDHHVWPLSLGKSQTIYFRRRGGLRDLNVFSVPL